MIYIVRTEKDRKPNEKNHKILILKEIFICTERQQDIKEVLCREK